VDERIVMLLEWNLYVGVPLFLILFVVEMFCRIWTYFSDRRAEEEEDSNDTYEIEYTRHINRRL